MGTANHSIRLRARGPDLRRPAAATGQGTDVGFWTGRARRRAFAPPSPPSRNAVATRYNTLRPSCDPMTTSGDPVAIHPADPGVPACTPFCWRTSTPTPSACSPRRVHREHPRAGPQLRGLACRLHGGGVARHPLDHARHRGRAGRGAALRAIGAFCIGTNQIDLTAAAGHGVAVFNAPYSNTRSVVEMAIAEIIALTRRLTEKNAAMHAGRLGQVRDRQPTRSAAARSASSVTATSAPNCPWSPRRSA